MRKISLLYNSFIGSTSWNRTKLQGLTVLCPHRVCLSGKFGAVGEIRTHEKSYLLTPYKSVALDHSATTAKRNTKLHSGRSRDRTGTPLLAQDFKSWVSTNSTIRPLCSLSYILVCCLVKFSYTASYRLPSIKPLRVSCPLCVSSYLGTNILPLLTS